MMGAVLGRRRPRRNQSCGSPGSPTATTRMLIDATRSWEFEPRPEWGGRHYPPINTIESEPESTVTARWDEYAIGMHELDDQRRELLTRQQLGRRLPDV